MLADLAGAKDSRLAVAADDASAADLAAAAAAGRKAGANFVVFGAYASDARQLRLTGHVVDVETGQSVGGLKATGNAGDAFPLEDEVAGQAMRYLGLDGGAAHGAGHRPDRRAARTGQGGIGQGGMLNSPGAGAIVVQPTGHATHARAGIVPPQGPATASYPYAFVAPTAGALEYAEQSVRLPLGYDPRDNFSSPYGPTIFFPLPDYSTVRRYPAYGYGGFIGGRHVRRYRGGGGQGGTHLAAAPARVTTSDTGSGLGLGFGDRPGPVYGYGYVSGYGFPEPTSAGSRFTAAQFTAPRPSPGTNGHSGSASHAGNASGRGRH